MRRTRTEVAVVGVGGAGVNAVSRLMDVGLGGVRFVAADTSVQTLARAAGARQVVLGDDAGGLGTGGDARLGAAAALGAGKALCAALAGADVVFVVAGLAGGTGGGAAPEVARLAGGLGAVTVGLGLWPFGFEAARRVASAARAARGLAAACDTTVRVENDRALAVAGGAVPLDVALRVADDVVRQAVVGLTALVAQTGWIRLDMAVVRGVLADAGDGCLALGLGRGEAPACAAVAAALGSPLADMRALARAETVLVQVTGGLDLGIADTAEAVAGLRARLGDRVELVVGVGLDPALVGVAQATLLGVGLAAQAAPNRAPLAWPGPPAQAGRAAVEAPIREVV